jgi:thiamine-monophosphate kinase
MNLEELGERGVIDRITKKFRADKGLIPVGAGEDDCAVIELDKARRSHRFLVVTTDTLLKSRHFPAGITPYQMGWSAVAVNLSDIAAMGAEPFAITIALGLPAQTEISFVDELTEGIQACAAAYETAVIGGDMTRSAELMLTGTCFGFATNPIRRAGAKVGDLICVTGSLGNAALALKAIAGELLLPAHAAELVKRALFQPQPRIREGMTIANSGVATAMMDISDGLALSLADIAQRSRVGMEVYEEAVPFFSEELRAEGDLKLSARERRELAFYCGGDYELLVTIDPQAGDDAAVLRALRSAVKLTVIGKVVPAERGLAIRRGSKREKLELKGYQHF